MSDNKMMKCPICNEGVPKGESTHYKKRYHHKECYDKRKAGEGDADKRVDLIDYIMKLHNIKRPSGMMLKQIKDMHENSGYTYQGMKLTLWYFHEIKGNPIKTQGIGIIPFVYNEAKEYYIKTMEARKHLHNLKKDGLTSLTTERTVRVQPKKLDIKKREKIDISEIK